MKQTARISALTQNQNEAEGLSNWTKILVFMRFEGTISVVLVLKSISPAGLVRCEESAVRSGSEHKSECPAQQRIPMANDNSRRCSQYSLALDGLFNTYNLALSSQESNRATCTLRGEVEN